MVKQAKRASRGDESQIVHKLQVDFTIEDPDTFNQPWKTYLVYNRGREAFYEDICAENNLNLFDYHMPVAAKPDF